MTKLIIISFILLFAICTIDGRIPRVPKRDAPTRPSNLRFSLCRNAFWNCRPIHTRGSRRFINRKRLNGVLRLTGSRHGHGRRQYIPTYRAGPGRRDIFNYRSGHSPQYRNSDPARNELFQRRRPYTSIYNIRRNSYSTNGNQYENGFGRGNNGYGRGGNGYGNDNDNGVRHSRYSRGGHGRSMLNRHGGSTVSRRRHSYGRPRTMYGAYGAYGGHSNDDDNGNTYNVGSRRHGYGYGSDDDDD